ncbi:unnamed protein product [Spodoptera exigua]|nr:unnamed protein product [Spodoptera exigua]
MGRLDSGDTTAPRKTGVKQQQHCISPYSSKFSEFLLTLGNKFIAGGDWNAKHTHWGSRLITTRGRQLKASIDANGMHSISSCEPTYWPTDPNKKPDLLDFFIFGGLSKHYLKAESCHDSSSDHTPVILTISTTLISYEEPESLYNKLTDWEEFRDRLEEIRIILVRVGKESGGLVAAVAQAAPRGVVVARWQCLWLVAAAGSAGAQRSPLGWAMGSSQRLAAVAAVSHARHYYNHTQADVLQTETSSYSINIFFVSVTLCGVLVAVCAACWRRSPASDKPEDSTDCHGVYTVSGDTRLTQTSNLRYTGISYYTGFPPQFLCDTALD